MPRQPSQVGRIPRWAQDRSVCGCVWGPDSHVYVANASLQSACVSAAFSGVTRSRRELACLGIHEASTVSASAVYHKSSHGQADLIVRHRCARHSSG